MEQDSAQALTNLLANMPEETLARWWVCLNGFQWPEDTPFACPEAWHEATTDRERMAAGRDLWAYIHAHTTERARSRAWWLLALGRTEGEWQAYWSRCHGEQGI